MNQKKSETCPDCEKTYEIGEWPYCPHGIPDGMMMFHPFWAYHMTEDPVYVTSWAHKKRLMKENRLDYSGKRVGMPGCEV